MGRPWQMFLELFASRTYVNECYRDLSPTRPDGGRVAQCSLSNYAFLLNSARLVVFRFARPCFARFPAISQAGPICNPHFDFLNADLDSYLHRRSVFRLQDWDTCPRHVVRSSRDWGLSFGDWIWNCAWRHRRFLPHPPTSESPLLVTRACVGWLAHLFPAGGGTTTEVAPPLYLAF
jgi:hypothetical protein